MTTQSQPHAGDLVAAVLRAQGVRFLFTLCGGHISPILSGSRALGIRVIDVRHEATAVFAADAVGRLTGIPGVAAVTAGPGLTNTLTALKNAQQAQSALVLLGGAAPTALQGRGALQDIDQVPVVAPHVKLVRRVRCVRDVLPMLEEAFAVAREGVPGPVFVECPIDVLYPEENVRQWYAEASGKGQGLADRALRWYLQRHADHMFARGVEVAPVTRLVPRPTVATKQVETIRAALTRAERPLMVIGSQALVEAGAAPRLAAAVTSLGIPVYLSGMARGLLGRHHPLQLRHQRRQALREADCVLLAGVPCDFRLDYGKHVRAKARLIAVNRSRQEALLNRRPSILAVGDAGLCLEDLAQGPPLELSAWLQQLRTRDEAREAEIREQALREGEWVNPIALLRHLEESAGERTVWVADGGDFVATASYVVRPRAPLGWLDPGAFGTLGVGAGFALGAALCHPEAEVWILWGDGACGYGLVELDTFVRHQIPILALVGNDAGWTQIAREQVKMLKDDVGTVLARTAYDQVAAGFGARGVVIKRNAEVPQALEEARAAARAGQPVLINAWLDRTDFREGSISM